MFKKNNTVYKPTKPMYGLTPKQKANLPKALQQAILNKKKK
jgi:hypothetical protein